MKNNWKTSVTEIMKIFRGALIAIIPWIEKAKISWKDGVSYDDWDNISEALFNNIVCSSIEGEVMSEYSLAAYDFQYTSYAGLDYIKVKSDSYRDKALVFVSFQTNSTPFDKINVGILDRNEQVTGFLSIDYSNVEFLLMKKTGDKRVGMEEISVVM